jgi:hypothetical protein
MGVKTLVSFRDSEPLRGLASAAFSSCESSSSESCISTGGLNFFAFGAGPGAAEVRVTATLFEFAVVRLAVDEFGTVTALVLFF